MNFRKQKSKIFPEHGNINNLKEVKFGIDPTSGRLHIGHLVPLLEVKRMLSLKKNVSVVLGTFTAMMGDPTGTNKTRPILPESEVSTNADLIMSIIEHIMKDLDHEISFVFNMDIARSIPSSELVKDAISKFTLGELMERKEFRDRPIGMQELIVPIMQAMDSVVLNTEIEIGGEDQLVNFSLTRKLQERLGKKPEICLMTPIIDGTDGKKMSKSLNNCIFLDDSDDFIRHKVINTKDEVVDQWIPVLTDREEWPDDPRERKALFSEELIMILDFK